MIQVLHLQRRDADIMGEGTMERENQRVAVTKRMLKESMLRLLKEKELDAINVTELCRDAGINRATFYRHYEIPRDVLLEIQKDFYHDLRQRIGLPKCREEVRPAIETLCCCMEENAQLLRIILQSSTDTDYVLFVNGIFGELWEEFGELGMLQLNREDAQLLTLYCAGGSYFVLRQWLLGNVHKNAKQMADYVYALLNKTDWATITAQLGLLPE